MSASPAAGDEVFRERGELCNSKLGQFLCYLDNRNIHTFTNKPSVPYDVIAAMQCNQPRLITLRGGMVGDDTRTPSSNSVDPNEQTRPASRTSTLNTDDVPDLEPALNAASSQILQSAQSTGVTPMIFINDAEHTGVILPEPDRMHLPRSIVEENLLQASGTIAARSTPVLGPGLLPSDISIAEYVDQRFNLESDAQPDDSTDQSGGRRVVFREPDYTQSDGAHDVAVTDDEEDARPPTRAWRISEAVRSTLPRIREFFPMTDIVTSSRASTLDPSTSRRPRASITTRQAFEDQNMVQRAVSRMAPHRRPEHFLVIDGDTSDIDTMDPCEEDCRRSTDKSQQVPRTARSILPPSAAGPGVIFDDQSWSPASPVQREGFEQDRGSAPTIFCNADQGVNEEADRGTRSSSVIQRLLRRVSTFTMSTRWGSAEGTGAPPPTREGSLEYVEDITHQSQQDPGDVTITIGRSLRHFASSSNILVRRGVSRFHRSHTTLHEDGHHTNATHGPEAPNRTNDDNRNNYDINSGQGTKQDQTRCRGIPREWTGSLRRLRAAVRRDSTPSERGCATMVQQDIFGSRTPEAEGNQQERPSRSARKTINNKARRILSAKQHVTPI